MDSQPPGLPHDYLDGQRYLDRLLRDDPTRPFLRVSSAGSSALAMYACEFASAVDEYDRPGIVLLCGFHGHRDEVVTLVRALLWLRSPLVADEVGQVVAALAAGGKADLGTVISLLDRAVSHAHREVPLGSDDPPVSAVVHDSEGAALAWQAMTIARAGATIPWVVYDDIESGNPPTIVTRAAGGPAGPRVLLSDLIGYAAREIQPRPPAHQQEQEQAPPPPPPTEPWWTRVPVWVAGTGVFALASLILVVVVLTSGGPVSPPQPRVIAQYDYRFDLPDGWAQTGGQPDLRSTEIRPTGTQAATSIVVLEPQDAAAAPGTDPATVDASGAKVDPVTQSTEYAGRNVIHERATQGRSVIDRYRVIDGPRPVEVDCQHPAKDGSTLSGCESVVHSLVIYG